MAKPRRRASEPREAGKTESSVLIAASDSDYNSTVPHSGDFENPEFATLLARVAAYDEPAVAAVVRFMQAARAVAKTHPRVAYLASQDGSGSRYSAKTAGDWGRGKTPVPASAIVALARACELSLDEHVLVNGRESATVKLEREVAALIEQRAYIFQMLDELGRGQGIDYLQRTRASNSPAVRRLAELFEELPPG